MAECDLPASSRAVGAVGLDLLLADLLGHLLLEVTQIGAQVSLLDQPEGDPEAQANTDLTQFPALLRTEALLSLDKSAAEFEEALENLLERLELVLREGRTPRRGDTRD